MMSLISLWLLEDSLVCGPQSWGSPSGTCSFMEPRLVGQRAESCFCGTKRTFSQEKGFLLLFNPQQLYH